MNIIPILISQYLASLKMLEQLIVACPEALWNDPADRNPTWHLAYHAIYFVEEYLADSYETFRPWAGHRRGYEEFPLPPDAKPYDKAAVLAYLAYAREHVQERLPVYNLGWGADAEYTGLELQIYNIRHLMQHTGELGERLGRAAGVELDWVGKGYET